MHKRIWLTLIASSILVVGLPGRAPAQIDSGAHAAARTGTFTTFDVPGAGTGSGQGTFANRINPEGAITGEYIDASFVSHGFLRKKDCDTEDRDRDCDTTFIKFDPPAAGTGYGRGTYPDAINPEGAITGLYYDTKDVLHGFLRDGDGTITTFDPAGSTATIPRASTRRV